MAMPRKSDALHKLHGSRPHDRVDGTPVPSGRPRYPKNVTAEARRVFKQLVSQLESRRTLTPGDGHLLTLYATIWDRRERAQARLLVEGEICAYTRLDPNGVAHKIEKANLNLKVAEVAEKQLVAILDRLGLTPMNAAKVKASLPVVKSAATPADTIEEFLAGKIVGGGETATFLAPPDDIDLN